MRLYVKENTGYILLDLMEDNPIKLTMAVADIMDPTANPSTYSQTFRVPNTANNNLFFKSAFNINAQTFDATKKIDAYIEDSNVTISVGSIRLTNIVTNNRDKNVEYEITFFGEVSDLAAKIGGSFMNSLNLSYYNHEKSYVNIVNSWNLNLFGGDVIYPLIEWGYDYLNGEPVQNTLSYRDGTHSKNGFTANNHPLSIDQFKPVIRAKVLFDAIFASSGFTYESTFLNGSDFMNQYVITEQTDSATASHESDIQLDVRNNSLQDVQPNTEVQLLFTNEIVDSLSSFDTITNYFTVPSTLPAFTFYEFNLKGLVFSDVFGPIVMTNVTIKAIDVATLTTLATYSISPSVTNININANLVLPSTVIAGQQIKFTIEINTVNSLAGIMLSILTQITGSGGLVILNNFLPNNVKNIDFLKGIIERYNLVLEPSKTKSKHFIITPWVDWVEQGTQRDWTDYVDGNVDIQSKPLFTSQTRSNTWRDDEDSDYVNYNFQTATKTTYGQYDLDSQIEILVGNNLVESLFAPTPLLPIGNASPLGNANQNLAAQFLIPHIAKDTTTERTPITPKLRLVYYNGMRSAPLQWHIKNDANVTQHWNQYPLVSQYSLLDNSGLSFNDMAWRNAAPLWDITPSVPNPPARTTQDLWNNYWRKWYEFTYDKYGRIVEMDIVLDYKKVWDLKFNDKIFIKDSWFMVNKITDYQVGKPTACKVELIRVGESISIVPRQLLTGQLMCYIAKPVTICDVYCCFVNGGANVMYYESNGQLFLDPNGNFPAPSGVYSYGASNTFSVINGIITTYHVTTSCVCVPNVIRYYQPCRGNSVYEAGCCQFPLQSFYAYSNSVYQATQAWSDAALTIPVADGWYANPGESFVAQFINGIKVQVAARITCIP
jgi:hypothetical protein